MLYPTESCHMLFTVVLLLLAHIVSKHSWTLVWLSFSVNSLTTGDDAELCLAATTRKFWGQICRGKSIFSISSIVESFFSVYHQLLNQKAIQVVLDILENDETHLHKARPCHQHHIAQQYSLY